MLNIPIHSWTFSVQTDFVKCIHYSAGSWTARRLCTVRLYLSLNIFWGVKLGLRDIHSCVLARWESAYLSKCLQLPVSLSFCKYSVVRLSIYLLYNHPKQLQKVLNLLEPSPTQKIAIFFVYCRTELRIITLRFWKERG